MGNGEPTQVGERQGLGWDASRRALRVQVFGASGAVGRELVRALLMAGHPTDHLELFAREAHRLGWYGDELAAKPMGSRHGTAELAFLCVPPEVARERAPKLVASGTRVIDLSGAFGQDLDIPLVAPGVNTGEVGAFTSLVALPDPATTLLAPLLASLDRTAGLGRVTLTHLRSAACRGARGILTWRRELARLVDPGGVAPALPSEPEASLAQGFDPREGGLEATGNANAELVLASELRRILGRPELAIAVSAVRVGSERVDGFSLDIGLTRGVAPEEAARAWAHTPGVQVLAGEGPDTVSALGEAVLQVGRIRTGSGGAGSVCFFAAGDRLRAGAALAALQVASSLPWA